MNALASLTSSLTNNVALLLVAMPLIGAVLVRLMSRSGREPVYFTALTNVWLCCGLVTLAVLQFELRSGFESLFRPQMLTSLEWPGLPDADQAVDEPASLTASANRPLNDLIRQARFPQPRISVAINGLNLWFVVLTVAGATAAVRGIDLERDFLASRLSWLLLTEAALIGTLVAQDVVLLSGFNLLSVIGLFFLIGYSSKSQRRAAARRFFRVQFGAALMLSVGLAGAAASHWWMTLAAEVAAPMSFSLNQIVAQVPDLAMTTETGRAYWNTISPWLFLLICGACVLRMPLPPLHHWWLQAIEHSDRGTSCLMACGFLPTGAYVIARVVGPLFPEQCVELTPRLLTWSLLAAVLLALSGLKLVTDGNARGQQLSPGKSEIPGQTLRLIGVALLICQSLAFGALITTEPLAIRGGLLLAVSATASAGLALWLLPAQVVSDSSLRPIERATSSLKWLSACGLVATPLSGTFWGLLLVAYGFSLHSAALTLLLLLVYVIFAGTVLRAINRPSTSVEVDPTANHPAPGLIGSLPLAAVLIVSAVYPTLICGPPPLPEIAVTASGSVESSQPSKAESEEVPEETE